MLLFLECCKIILFQARTNLGLGSSNSPTFAGLTITGLGGFLKATVGVVGTSTIAFTDLTGSATDAQIPDTITIANNATTGTATLLSLTSIGTIATGTWQSTAIGDTWISSAATWSAKQDALLFPLVYASTTHITATAPLTISSGVISIPTSTASVSGYLSSADWTIFNAKEPAISAGITAQYWRGDKSWQTLNQAAVAGLTTGDSPTFAGLTLAGNFLPATTTTYNLGSSDYKWANLYVSTTTIGGTITIGTNTITGSGTTTFSTLAGKLVLNSSGNIDLGTVTSGAWQGTPVAAQYGGTGQNFANATSGSIVYFSSTGTMAVLPLGSSGQYLKMGSSAPEWTTLSMTASNITESWAGNIQQAITNLRQMTAATRPISQVLEIIDEAKLQQY